MLRLERVGLAGLVLARCLSLYWCIIWGRAALDVPALARELRRTGLEMLPAMTIVALVVGASLGHQGTALLARAALPGWLLPGITFTVIVEFAPLLTGILVAGRAGVALAAHLARLQLSGELDGLRVCGIDPIEFSVAPLLVALMMMSFALSIWTSLIMLLVLFGWLYINAQVPVGLMLEMAPRALSITALLAAASKPLLFALTSVLLAAVYGIQAGYASDGSGRAATQTLISAVTLILLLDLGFVLWWPW